MCLREEVVAGCVVSAGNNGRNKGTYARSASAAVLCCLCTNRLDCASIWSRDSCTEGRSGRERWDVRFLDAAKRADRSDAIVHRARFLIVSSLS